MWVVHTDWYPAKLDRSMSGPKAHALSKAADHDTIELGCKG